MWAPGHVSTRGNEAFAALDKKPTADFMPFSDLKPLTAKYVYIKEWNESFGI